MISRRPCFLLPKLKFLLVYKNITQLPEYNTKWGRNGKKWQMTQRPGSSCLLQCNMLLKCAKSLQLCPTLFDPMDCESTCFSIYGISQGRILEWVAMPSSRGSFWPRDWTHISLDSCTAGGFFPLSHQGSQLFRYHSPLRPHSFY